MRRRSSRRHDAADGRRDPGRSALAHHHLPGPLLARGGGYLDGAGASRAGPTIPILGVCLGHQCIGAAYGGEIVRAGRPMHGKTSRIHHRGTGLFTGPSRRPSAPPAITRSSSPPPRFRRSSTSLPPSEDGEIMAVQHARDPVYGVQFHPESVLTEQGYRLRRSLPPRRPGVPAHAAARRRRRAGGHGAEP